MLETKTLPGNEETKSLRNSVKYQSEPGLDLLLTTLQPSPAATTTLYPAWQPVPLPRYGVQQRAARADRAHSSLFPTRSEFYIFILKVENVAVCQTGLEISENKVQIVHVQARQYNI